MKHIALFSALIILASITGTALAEFSNNKHPPEQYADKLDKFNFLPNLLSVIIENSNAVELTDKQVNTLLAWHKSNKKNLFASINEIAVKRVAMKEAALSPVISAARLIQMQNEIFRLQRQMLNYKLSCRDLVIKTFNNNNWENFFLVLADKETELTLPDLYISSR